MGPTKVINLKGRDHEAMRAYPRFVYVGRGNRFTGYKGSALQNKFKGANAVGSYLHWIKEILSRKDSDLGLGLGLLQMAYAIAIREELANCRGKMLGCWCVNWDGRGEPPMACHAVVIALLADGKDVPKGLPCK